MVSNIMSTFFDFNVGSKGFRFRRAVDFDCKDVESLPGSILNKRLFGDVNVGNMIEHCTLSISMLNDKKEVVGFMALNDSPNISTVDPDTWDIWIRNLYQKYYMPRNTLFVHYMNCTENMADAFLEHAYVSVFMNDQYLNNIILIVPPSFPKELLLHYKTIARKRIFKVFPKNVSLDEQIFHNTLYDAARSDFCPKLRIRKAVEEDNDDILGILDQCPKLRQTYGNFFISEIIGRHPEIPRVVIVAEQNAHELVGVMCLNSKINYTYLQKTYELEPHHGLVTILKEEKESTVRGNTFLTCFGEPIMTGKFGPYDPISKLSVLEKTISGPRQSYERRKSVRHLDATCTRVNFPNPSTVLRRSFDLIFFHNQNSDDFSDKLSTASENKDNSWISVDLEADPFDYDIVNIDLNLLKVPQELTSTSFTVSKIDLIPKADKSKIPMKENEHAADSLRSKMLEPETSQTVTHIGEPNAFMIEIYAMREDIDDRRAFDMLEAAFYIFPQHEYCLIRVPTTDKWFPLLEHFCIVPTKVNICSEYSLYVAHRNSIFGKLRVRGAEFADLPAMANLLSAVRSTETLWTVEHCIRSRSGHQPYVLYSGLRIVGLAVLEPPDQIDFIQTKFKLDSFYKPKYHTTSGPYRGFSNIKTIVVYPAFEQHFRFFARDMMRQSGSYAFMWLSAYRNKWVIHRSNALVSAMIPLMPRHTDIETSQIPELTTFVQLAKEVTAFGAWFLNRNLTSVRRATVDMRIVIVGASRTALGFIDALLFSDAASYLTFNNVTLVSPNGLPYMRQMNDLASKMFLQYHATSDQRVKSVPYTYYLNLIQGTVTAINRQLKYVTLKNGGRVAYDRLFLMTGKQYQAPDYLTFEPRYYTKAGEREPKPNPDEYIGFDDPRRPKIDLNLCANEVPPNVFIVNDLHTATKAINFVRILHLSNPDYKVVVYGATIEAYCCINALMEADVDVSRIIFVEPFPPENPYKMRIPCFISEYVDQKVQETLRTLKITIHRGYYFDSWVVDSRECLTRVDFVSNFEMLKIECSALFYYGTRGMDANAYTAVQKSGIVYMGGIMVDGECRTSDPAVYAAGPATRPRSQYAVVQRHKYHDSYDVGFKLGTRFRNELDPLFQYNEKCEDQYVKFATSPRNSSGSRMRSDIPVKGSCRPVEVRCCLPGGLRLLTVRTPGLRPPHDFMHSQHYHGILMETYKQGYFKIHLTPELTVDSITCLTTHSFPLEHFKYLYGLNSVVLNNVCVRYNAKMIDNFYEFFNQPWAQYLYHDQRDELFSVTKEILPLQERVQLNKSMKETLTNIAKAVRTDALKQKSLIAYLRNTFSKSPYVEAITSYVLEWVRDHDLLLPMYLQPREVAVYSLRFEHCLRRKKRSIHKMIAYSNLSSRH